MHNNSLQHGSIVIFTTPILKLFESGDFRLCCFVPNKVKCISKRTWFKSCEYILLNNAVQITFYCVSFTIVFLNSISLLSQLVVSKRSKKYYSVGMIVGLINISNFSYVISLSILWSADLYFKGNYALKDHLWRSGKLCFIILSMHINFHLLSPLLLSLLSLSRLMVVIHPLDSNFKESNYVLKYLICLSLGTASISLVISFTEKIIYSSTATHLCSPFIDPTNSHISVKFLSWVFACLEFSIILFITFAHCLLLKTLRESQKELKQSVSKEQSNFTLIAQLLIITITGTLSWVPSRIVYLASMYLVPYRIALVTWTIITVVPITCIINPIVFILTTLRRSIN